jgi:hypothetical protein
MTSEGMLYTHTIPTHLGTVEYARGLLIEDDGLPVEVGS